MPVRRRKYKANIERSGKPFGPGYRQQGLFHHMGDIPGGGSEDPATLLAALGATLFRFARAYRIRSEQRYRTSLLMVEIVQETLRAGYSANELEHLNEQVMGYLPNLMIEIQEWCPPYTYVGQYPSGPYPMRQGVWPDQKAINRDRANLSLQVVTKEADIPEEITAERGLLVFRSTDQTGDQPWIGRYGFFLPDSHDEAMLIWEWFPAMTRRTTKF